MLTGRHSYHVVPPRDGLSPKIHFWSDDAALSFFIHCTYLFRQRHIFIKVVQNAAAQHLIKSPKRSHVTPASHQLQNRVEGYCNPCRALHGSQRRHLPSMKSLQPQSFSRTLLSAGWLLLTSGSRQPCFWGCSSLTDSLPFDFRAVDSPPSERADLCVSLAFVPMFCWCFCSIAGCLFPNACCSVFYSLFLWSWDFCSQVLNQQQYSSSCIISPE